MDQLRMDLFDEGEPTHGLLREDGSVMGVPDPSNVRRMRWALRRLMESGMDRVPLHVQEAALREATGRPRMGLMDVSDLRVGFGVIRRLLGHPEAPDGGLLAGSGVQRLVRVAGRLDRMGLWRLADGLDRLASPIMELHHGTRDPEIGPEDLESREPGYDGSLGEGVYFGEEPETAEYYAGPHGRVLHRRMDIRNPLVIDGAEGINHRPAPESESDIEEGRFDSIIPGEVIPPFDVFIDGEWCEIRDGWDLRNIGHWAAEAGHDAVILRNVRWSHGPNEEVLVLPHHPGLARTSGLTRTASRDSERFMIRSGMSEVIMGRLYHTTSIPGMEGILTDGVLNGERFVSLSEVPLFHGDISADAVVIVFDAGALMRNLMRVEYDDVWAEEHPDHVDYIAGDGWREQYQFQEPDGWDEDDLDELQEEDERLALQEAFEVKRDEREWVSKIEWEPVPFQASDILGIIVKDQRDVPLVRRVLQERGLGSVPVSVR